MSARNLRRNSPSRFSLLEILAVLFVPQGLPLGGGEIIYLRVDSSRCKISRKKKRKEKKRREKKVSRASNGVAKCCGDGESFLYAQQKRGEELKRETKRGQSERNAALAQKRDGRRKKYGRERERERVPSIVDDSTFMGTRELFCLIEWKRITARSVIELNPRSEGFDRF